MESRIQAELSRIERQFQVTCLFACESGSRAWDFPSTDSDYDVRFVYFHPLPWYLQVFQQRDVIEKPIDGLLDISGWELRKALRLLWKSNPALLEWLSSPIVYRSHRQLDAVKKLVAQAFLPKSSCHHYLALARRYLNRLAENEKITAKSYLYALRALFCCRWVIERLEQPPMRFTDMLAALALENEIKQSIETLLEQKAGARESDTIAKVPLLDDYLAGLSQTLEPQIPHNPETRSNAGFNTVFRSIIGAGA